MDYESPTLELMGQMDELTGSLGVTITVGDCYYRCMYPRYENGVWYCDDWWI